MFCIGIIDVYENVSTVVNFISIYVFEVKLWAYEVIYACEIEIIYNSEIHVKKFLKIIMLNVADPQHNRYFGLAVVGDCPSDFGIQSFCDRFQSNLLARKFTNTSTLGKMCFQCILFTYLI